MKKLVLTSLMSLSALSTSAFAQMGPANAMDGYTPTDISSSELGRIWGQMRTDLKGKDCYKRAHLWAWDMYANDNIESRKIFIHYTDKFNRELDNMGREDGLSFLKRKQLKIEGADERTVRMIRHNVTWDYHVAPMLKVDGKDVVVDRYLTLPYDAKYPYNSAEAWKLEARPATPEEWVEALTIRGELMWQARRTELNNEINEYREKYYKATGENRKAKFRALLVKAQNSYKKLGMDKASSIDIKCRKITSMVELDRNQMDEWCFWSETPMYYFNEIDLRNLAYGQQPLREGESYIRAVDPKYATEENFMEGRTRFVQTKFNEEELKVSQSEIKSDSEEQKRRDEEEKRLEEEAKRQEELRKEEAKRLEELEKEEERRKKAEEKERKRAERRAQREAERNE